METSLVTDSMFMDTHQLNIEIDKSKASLHNHRRQFDSPLCSSSNTSSSSSKVTNPSEQATPPTKPATNDLEKKFISSTFIPLNQSRTLDTCSVTNQTNITNSKTRPDTTNQHPLLSHSSSSNSSVVASLSVLSFSDSNSISSLSSSISYGDVTEPQACSPSANTYFTNSAPFHRKCPDLHSLTSQSLKDRDR